MQIFPLVTVHISTLERRIRQETTKSLEIMDKACDITKERSKFNTQLAQRTIPFITTTKELADMRSDIEDLYQGHISTNLISQGSMKTQLNIVDKYLQDNGISLQLTSKNVMDIYIAGAYSFYRENDILWLAVQIPLSPLQRAMTLYKIHSFPLSIPNQLLATQIIALPEYVAISEVDKKRIEFDVKPPLIKDHYLVMTKADGTLSDDSQMSCTSALIADSHNDIIEKCKINLLPTEGKSRAILLNKDSLLLVNSPDYFIKCSNQTERKLKCNNLCVIKMICDCIIRTESIVQPAEYVGCRNNVTHAASDMTTKYGVNLLALQLFQNSTGFAGDQRFDKAPEIVLPDLTDHLDSYGKLSQRIRQGEVDLKSLRHPDEIAVQQQRLISELLPSHGILWYTFDFVPLIILNAIVTIMIVVAIIRMSSKLSSMMALLAGGQLSQLAGSQSIPPHISTTNPIKVWQFYQTQTPVITEQPIYQKFLETVKLIREVDTIEAFQLMALIFLVIGVMYIIHRRWFRAFETKIYLELGTMYNNIQLELITVPHKMRHYTVHADKTLQSCQIIGNFWPRLILGYEKVMIKHSFAKLLYHLPTELKLNWYQAYRVLQILQNSNSYYYLLLSKDHKNKTKIISVDYTENWNENQGGLFP
jgi:hypothetical protein